MRLAELDLVAYGAFVETRLILPPSSPDLHLVVGPNAAGKSTLREALADALFGFPHRSRMNFDLDYGRLQVGLTVAHGDERFQAIRKKSSKRSLVDVDGAPVDETRLVQWLAGTTRERFEQAFALDDGRLRRAGEAILQGRDDLAGLLFAASSGVERLGDVVADLEKAAAAAWSTDGRKASRGREAEARHRDATRALKETRVQAAAYRARRAAVASREQAEAAARAERDHIRHDVQRVQLALRVLEPLARLQGVRARLAALDGATLLPADAGAVLATAIQRIALADQVLARDGARRQRLEAAIVELPEREPMLAQRQAVDAFLGQVAVVQSQAADRPRALADVAAAEAAAVAALVDAGLGRAEAGVPAASALERLELALPPLEQLARDRADLAARTRQATAAVADAEAAVAAAPSPPDPAALTAASQQLGVWRAAGLDVEALGAAVASSRAALADALDRLAPWTGDPDQLSSAALPSPEREEALRQDLERHRQALARVAERAAGLDAERGRLHAERLGLSAAPDLVETAALAAARADRDARWQAFREAALRPGDARPAAADGAAVDAALVAADHVADARFAAAERVVRLDALTAKLVALDQEAGALAAEAARLQAAAAAVEAAWTEPTAGTALAGVGLARAARWRQDLEAALRARGQHREALAVAARAEAARVEVRRALTAALAESGVAFAEDASLEWLGATLDRGLAAATETAATSAALHQALVQAEAELRRCQRASSEQEPAWEAAAARVAEAAAAVGLDPDVDAAEARSALERLRAARRHREAARDIRTRRLDAADAEAASLAEQARQLAAELDLPQAEPTTLKSALLEAREAATARAARRIEQLAELERVTGGIASEVRARDEAAATLAPLIDVVGTDDHARLQAAVAASDERRALEADVADREEALTRLAPGFDESALRDLVGDRELGSLQLEAEDLESALDQAERQLEELLAELAQARAELAGVDDGDTAAALEAERQEAAAALAHAVEDHVEQLVTARLLRRALDDYRAANETPLLRRASALFEQLSLGEFTRLTVDHGDGAAVLVGVRPNGRLVGRDGMSAGTVDQLYLALRLAALHLHLDHAPPLPFVADDLLVQFSDDRAAAGLRVLADLARRTQVIVFTHHRHLADLATATLGAGGVAIHHLEGRRAQP